MMRESVKDFIQYGSAVFMLVSGVAMAFLCFFLNSYELSDSVLWYVAQCLIYAGSALGIKGYIDTRFKSEKHDITSRKESMES